MTNMKNNWFIYDRDLSFAEKLSDYLISRQPLQTGISAYSEPEALKKRLSEKRGDTVLILAESSFEEWMAGSHAVTVILDEGEGLELPGAIRISRYQSAEGIWEELIKKLELMGKRVKLKRSAEEKARLSSFFSPERRVLQTGFMLQYGRVLAEQGPVLCLHFDGLTPLEELLGNHPEKSLMDLLYLWECGDKTSLPELSGGLCRIGSLWILGAAGAPRDIHSVKEETWLSFLEALQRSGEYSHILLDLKEHVEGLFSILQMSDEYFELRRPGEEEDATDRIRTKELERQMKSQGFGILLENRRLLRIPRLGSGPYREPGSGELYRMARKLAEELKG